MNPPFFADHVGSLLRPAALKKAREEHFAGRLPLADLTGIEDIEIRRIVKAQENVGLHSITDGELRRSWWHMDFLGALDGVEMIEVDQGIQFAGVQTKAQAPRVMGKLGSRQHPHIEHFRFLAQNTTRTPKQAIPSPSMLHYRGGRKLINMGVYPTMDEFYDDLGQAYAQAVRGFYDAGCRYLQIDDCSFAYLCDPQQRAMLSERGDDPDRQGEIYAGMINAALKDKPADLAVTMHVLPWQLSLHVRRVGRLRAHRRPDVQPRERRRLFPRMGTTSDPAASSLCAISRRASASCSASSRPRRARSRPAIACCGASTRRRATRRSTSCGSARNAASPRPRRATPSPKTSNGRS